jgi:hypothetical protein
MPGPAVRRARPLRSRHQTTSNRDGGDALALPDPGLTGSPSWRVSPRAALHRSTSDPEGEPQTQSRRRVARRMIISATRRGRPMNRWTKRLIVPATRWPPERSVHRPAGQAGSGHHLPRGARRRRRDSEQQGGNRDRRRRAKISPQIGGRVEYIGPRRGGESRARSPAHRRPDLRASLELARQQVTRRRGDARGLLTAE